MLRVLVLVAMAAVAVGIEDLGDQHRGVACRGEVEDDAETVVSEDAVLVGLLVLCPVHLHRERLLLLVAVAEVDAVEPRPSWRRTWTDRAGSRGRTGEGSAAESARGETAMVAVVAEEEEGEGCCSVLQRVRWDKARCRRRRGDRLPRAPVRTCPGDRADHGWQVVSRASSDRRDRRLRPRSPVLPRRAAGAACRDGRTSPAPPPPPRRGGIGRGSSPSRPAAVASRSA